MKSLKEGLAVGPAKVLMEIASSLSLIVIPHLYPSSFFILVRFQRSSISTVRTPILNGVPDAS